MTDLVIALIAAVVAIDLCVVLLRRRLRAEDRNYMLVQRLRMRRWDDQPD